MLYPVLLSSLLLPLRQVKAAGPRDALFDKSLSFSGPFRLYERLDEKLNAAFGKVARLARRRSASAAAHIGSGRHLESWLPNWSAPQWTPRCCQTTALRFRCHTHKKDRLAGEQSGTKRERCGIALAGITKSAELWDLSLASGLRCFIVLWK